MNLVIFDIDGTMLNSSALEDALFIKAVEEVLKVKVKEADWTHFENVTDEALAYDICQLHLQREITAHEMAAIKAMFLSLYQQELIARPELVFPVRGIHQFIKNLEEDPNYKICVATGSWKNLALLKLGHVSIDVSTYAMATSDDHYRRIDITRTALARAKELYKEFWFEHIYLFGDGVWDLHVGRGMCVPFIGVDNDESGQLQELGATHVIEDYSDQATLFEWMAYPERLMF